MTKKFSLAVFGIALIALMVSVWFGGRKKWELMGIGPETIDASSLSTAYEKKRGENPDNPVLQYNLAYFYYRQNRFKEAETVLTELLNTPDLEWEIAQKASYNLGNVLFRQSEKEASEEQALALLQRSLAQYRAVKDIEAEKRFYTTQTMKSDEDARFNYAVVKQRIKILVDQIEKRKKDQQRKKELFVLLRELLEQEKQIRSQLEAIPKLKNVEQKNEKRNLLLKKQAENLEQLRTVKEKIREVLMPGKSRATAPVPTV